MPAVWDPPLTDEPPWPVSGDGPFILLIDAKSTMERELIKGWIERNRPDGARVDTAYIPAGRMLRRRRRTASPSKITPPRRAQTLAAK